VTSDDVGAVKEKHRTEECVGGGDCEHCKMRDTHAGLDAKPRDGGDADGDG